MTHSCMRKILCVDDEPRVLNGLKRNLSLDFDIMTAESGREGLERIASSQPFAVVVSDMRMPQMDGASFLKKVWEVAPDTTRVLLTGEAEIDSAIAAVNEGHIFRFLKKPCPPDELKRALIAATEQYDLVRSERVLLEETLHQSVKTLTDILSIVSPSAFSRSSRILRLVKKIIKQLGVEDGWRFELAAMLSQIGCVTLPDAIVDKVCGEQALSPDEEKMFFRHPQAGYDLVRHIPRLDSVAEMIYYQEKKYNGEGVPDDDRKGKEIPLGARVLRVAFDYDALARSKDPYQAVSIMQERTGE